MEPIQRLAAALADPKSYATTLVAVAIDALGHEVLMGPDAVRWHPATVHRELQDRFGPVLDERRFDRLMCGLWLLTTDRFYRTAADFGWASCVLSDHPAVQDAWEPPDAAECAWGITEALFLAPPGTAEPFSPEVRRYVGAICRLEGLVGPPDVLRIGLPPAPVVQALAARWAHEPGLAEAVAAVAKAKADAITSTLREGVDALLKQLESLPLSTGDARNLRDRLSKKD